MNRCDYPENLKWKLEDIFLTDNDWEDCFSYFKKCVPELKEYKGKLSDKNLLFEFLEKREKAGFDYSRLYVYSHMRKDEDTANSFYQAMCDKIEAVGVEFSSSLSFMMPELVSFSDEVLQSLISDPKFKDYDVLFKEVLRSKKIILSDKEEKILADSSLFRTG